MAVRQRKKGRRHQWLSHPYARGRVIGSVSPWPMGQILMRRLMLERLMRNS